MGSLNTDYQIGIINKIKQLRTEHKFSQQQLAQILGVTNGHMGNIESLHYPTKYTLRQLTVLASEFKCPIEHFFMEEGESRLSNAVLVDRICRYLEGEP